MRRRASAVCCHQGRLLSILVEDPTSKEIYPILPGGSIEAGESPEQAVIRETQEETGYLTQVASDGVVLTYEFLWDGRMVPCETNFYRTKIVTQITEVIDDAPFHRGVTWIPLRKVEEQFSYHQEILEVMKLLMQ